MKKTHNEKNDVLGKITERMPRFILPVALYLRETSFGIAYRRYGSLGVISEVLWLQRRIYESWRKFKISNRSEQKTVELIKYLKNIKDNSNIKISLACLSRRIGNRDSNLPKLLNSALRTAVDFKAVEIVVKIDCDDDLEYYFNVKKIFEKKIAIKIIVSERLNGAASMHIFYDEILESLSPGSEILQIVSDDAVFIKNEWDKIVLNNIRNKQEDYVGGENSFQEVVSTVDTIGLDNKSPKIKQFKTNNYPFVSVSLLNKLKKISKEYPGWTAFGNTLCVDTYFSAITSTAYHEYNNNMYIPIPKILEREGVVSFLYEPERSSVRYQGIIETMSDKHFEIRKKLLSKVLV